MTFIPIWQTSGSEGMKAIAIIIGILAALISITIIVLIVFFEIYPGTGFGRFG